MTHKIVEVTAPAPLADELCALAERRDVDVLRVWQASKGKCTVTLLAADDLRQTLLDDIHARLEDEDGWRVLVLDVSAVIPDPQQEEDDEDRVVDKSDTRSREELYNEVAKGARLDATRLLLVVISALVASAGMVKGSVAVVIGAMVIAPLIGPLLALTLATTLGDAQLILRAARSAGLGVAVSILGGLAFALLFPFDPAAPEIVSRTEVGFDNVGLALASGAAAALSLTAGVSGALVGVMVAVALLPPAATVGMLLGKGLASAASGAALLLAVNVAAVTLAGQLVLLAQGVRPRTWYENKNAKQSVRISLVFWTCALAALGLLIWLRGRTFLG